MYYDSGNVKDDLCGVPGVWRRVHKKEGANGLFVKQQFVSEPRPIKGYGRNARIKTEARFDDQCGNGHNSFAITATVYIPGRSDIEAGGCMHEEIVKYFPELEHLIRWHLCDSDGPMGYPGNPIYLAGDRDCWGLRKGEKRQIRNRRTGQLAWKLMAIVDGEEKDFTDLPLYADSDERPQYSGAIKYVPWCRVGEGKERDLLGARLSACWPEATDEQLCLPKEQLEALLMERLPKLLEDFRDDLESAGFLWTP